MAKSHGPGEAGATTRRDQGPHRPTKKRKRKLKPKKVEAGSMDDVLRLDVMDLRRRHHEVAESSEKAAVKEDQQTDAPAESLPERFQEIEVEVEMISSSGDGLAYEPRSRHVYVVPFTAAGDRVVARAAIQHADLGYTLADLVKVVKPSSLRDDSLVKCPYFGQCSGCQFQMLSYPTQLEHKRTIVEKAYKNFSGLDPGLVPAVEATFGSPLQYGYRTKLTPHFRVPLVWAKKAHSDAELPQRKVPPIGFQRKNYPHAMDIEDCPIGTDVVRLGLKRERQRVARDIYEYKTGETILLRESTKRVAKSDGDQAGNRSTSPAARSRSNSPGIVREEHPDHYLERRCITNPNALTTEFVGSFKFQNIANSFFQNNNSILADFTSYIRSRLDNVSSRAGPSRSPTPSNPPSSPARANDQNIPDKAMPIKYLVDAYCGSGLFTVTLSSAFRASVGVDIDPQSIKAAYKNVALNQINNAEFHTADAPAIFESITFPPDQTVVVIDPPRKGCNESFLRQLLAYGPKKIVYVSCNVHTQARDVGVLVRGMEGEVKMDGQEGSNKGVGEKEKEGDAGEGRGGEMPGTSYFIESIKPFDFFPQTGHVEGVAILNRKE